MNTIIYLFVLGICLSIDAFSVSLNLGWQIKSHFKQLLFSIIVGNLHFIMPILGAFLGAQMKNIIIIDTSVFMGIILLFMALESLINIKKDADISLITNLALFSIALSVSLDSFTMGIGLIMSNINILLSGFIFSICSFSFTYMGLILGKYLSMKYDRLFKVFSVILLLFLGIIHILI